MKAHQNTQQMAQNVLEISDIKRDTNASQMSLKAQYFQFQLKGILASLLAILSSIGRQNNHNSDQVRLSIW